MGAQFEYQNNVSPAHITLHYADPGPPAAGSLGPIGTRNTSYIDIYIYIRAYRYYYRYILCIYCFVRSAQGINRRRIVKLCHFPSRLLRRIHRNSISTHTYTHTHTPVLRLLLFCSCSRNSGSSSRYIDRGV